MKTCTRHPELRDRAAMTLLELIIAITIFSALLSLAAALWAQTAKWADDNAAHQQILRVQQAHDLAREQWEARRTTARLSEEGAATVALTPEAATFITSTPVLFPDWPLVRASWLIERRFDVLQGTEDSAELIYEETRITHPEYVLEGQYDIAGKPLTRRLVALDDCQRLHWETWQAPTRELRSFQLDATDPMNLWRELERGEEVIEEETASPLEAAQEERVDTSSTAASTNKRTDTARRDLQREEKERQRQRQQGDEAQPLRAFRLTGTRGREEFIWTFIVEPSR